MSSVINIEEYQNVPARALNMSIRKFLSHMLDREGVSMTSRHLLMNWMGLAELLGYSYDAIMNFDSNGSRGKTRMLLGDYTMKGGDVGTLLLSLQELERYDILEDAGFRENLRTDVAAYLSSQQQQNTQRPPEQDPKVTSAGPSCLDPGMYIDGQESMALTIQDSETGTATEYDAYVVYADEDFTFVSEMIDQLEAKFGLRLCISNRDMLAGSAEFQAVAALIKKRCKKVIVVMSPAFKRSHMCTFATNFAFSLCPSTLRGILVPILYKPCQIPDILLYIAPLDFTKVEYIQWFWERLQHSLRPRHVTGDQSSPPEQSPPYEESDSALCDIVAIPCDAHEGAISEASGCIADASSSIRITSSSTGDLGSATANRDGVIGCCTGDTVFYKSLSSSDLSNTTSSNSGSGKSKKKSIFTKLKSVTKQQSQKGHVTTVGLTAEHEALQ